MTAPEPTQPLTEDTELDETRAAVESWHDAQPFHLDALDELLEAFDRVRREHADFREMSMTTLHSQTAEIEWLRAELERVRGQRNQRGQSDGRKAALLVEAREERERALEQRDALAAKLAALDQSGEGQANG
jgi:predicted transcriptional regulator